MAESQPKLYEIPADALPHRCSACGAVMYKVRNPATGNVQPLAVAASYEYKGVVVTTGAAAPAPPGRGRGGAAGKGYSHFLDCPDARRFSRRGSPSAPKNAPGGDAPRGA